jgi:hypothetical protein
VKKDRAQQSEKKKVMAATNSSSYEHPPKPTLNGGLYTGEPFAPNAPWRNFPIEPDAGVYAFGNLRGIAPEAALYMLPGGGLRPGNSTPLLPAEHTSSRIAHLNAVCIPPSAYAAASAVGNGANHGFRQFSYL